MKYIQKDIHYSITKKEQGILKIRRKYNNLSGCRTLSLFTYTTFYVFSATSSKTFLIISPVYLTGAVHLYQQIAFSYIFLVFDYNKKEWSPILTVLSTTL